MKAPLLERHEIQLVKDWVLLPVLLEVIERDIQVMEQVKLRLAPVFMEVLRELEPAVIREISAIKQQLRWRGIQVYEQHRTPERLEVKYKCRGYEHRLHLLWGLVRAELLQKIRRCVSLHAGEERSLISEWKGSNEEGQRL